MESQPTEASTTHDASIAGDGPLVLVVDDDSSSRLRLQLLLQRLAKGDSDPVRVQSCPGISQALDILASTRAHVMLLDKDLGPDGSGIDAIPGFLHAQPHLQIVMVTGSKDVQDSVRAIQAGALGYVTKDSNDDLILSQILRALEVSQIAIQNYRHDRLQHTAPVRLGGQSLAFRQVLSHAQLLSESNRPVLLLGETGTGKSVLARYIHDCRKSFTRAVNPEFVPLNVATLSPDIVERELFGHEKGAFTDATESRPGFFEIAGNNGTLFLDEIGEASLDLQKKLLTTIETGEYFRVGGNRKHTSRPKIILATNRNLEELIEQKLFREDLYRRITSFTLRMPSLAERREDIPDIIRAMWPKCCADNNIKNLDVKELPQDFIEYLTKSKIEGNLRGVEHQLERLLVYANRDRHGKPILKQWRGIPGLHLKPGSSSPFVFKESRNTLTLHDILNKPFDMIGPDFPGLIPFMKLVQQKLLEEANKKFTTNLAIAKAFRVTASYTSRLRRGIADVAFKKRSYIRKKRSSRDARK